MDITFGILEDYTPECISLAEEIADRLNEDNYLELLDAVDRLGVEKARELLNQTLEIEAGQGMLIRSKLRRRTPGGVFFRLAYQVVEKPPHPNEAFEWQDREKYFRPLLDSGQRGELRSMMVTVSGRPRKVVKKGDCAILTFRQPPVAKVGVPKGLPKPLMDGELDVVVYMPTLKFSQVMRELARDETKYMVIRGIAQFDPAIPGMTVWANNVAVVQKKPKAAEEGVRNAQKKL